MIKSHEGWGKKIPKDRWLENLLQQLHETLEIRDGNESGLYILQKTNAHTFPAEWAFNRRQAE